MPKNETSLCKAPELFKNELKRLVDNFESNFKEYQDPSYNEARVRQDFIDPFFLSLGWDISNKAGFIQSRREVEIESATRIAGSKKRADYLFRVDGIDRFVCEAKKPSEILADKYIFQAKRYAWNKEVSVALLSDFEELKIYIVGSRPDSDLPSQGEWKVISFKEYLVLGDLIWSLLSRESVKNGSIESLIDSLPKKAAGKGRLKQGYLIKPDRTKSLDSDFLAFLDEARHGLASSLARNNKDLKSLESGRLNEATQHILDRILFLRICEDRNIDTGRKLISFSDVLSAKVDDLDSEGQLAFEALARKTRVRNESLYGNLVHHFKALDKRPASSAPFFNGQLFKEHFSESLTIDNDFLKQLIDDLSDENSPYLFNVIPVEILGSVYERFLGKVVKLKGRGITIEEKPEVRKAGGVYYTPRYVVDFIVENTVGNILENIFGLFIKGDFKDFQSETERLKFCDPACGSGSFLIRVFERICEHYQRFLNNTVPSKINSEEREKWKRRFKNVAWIDDDSGDLHLTVDFKRRILVNNIFGVDIDSSAVEVTQLSLYLKMLENENKHSLQKERDFLTETTPLLPELKNNIKCGNSLISTDFSIDPEELASKLAFDWATRFPDIFKKGGFDAVVGNPPYILMQELDSRNVFDYLKEKFKSATYKIDTYQVFLEKGLQLLKEGGSIGFITPNSFLRNKFAISLREVLLNQSIIKFLRLFHYPVFSGASVDTCILIACKGRFNNSDKVRIIVSDKPDDLAHKELPQSKWMIHDKKEFFLPLNEESESILAKISSRSHELRNLADAYFGIQTFDRERFVSTSAKTKYYLPVIDGENILELELLPSSEFVDFRPAAIKSGGNPDVYAQERIGIRQIGVTPVATYLPSKLLTLNTIYNIFITKSSSLNIIFILGVIISDVVKWFWLQHFYDQKDTFPKIKKDYILSIPVPNLLGSDSETKRFVLEVSSLVDKIMSLKPKIRTVHKDAEKETLMEACAASINKLNQIFFDFYKLSLDEQNQIKTDLGRVSK